MQERQSPDGNPGSQLCNYLSARSHGMAMLCKKGQMRKAIAAQNSRHLVASDLMCILVRSKGKFTLTAFLISLTRALTGTPSATRRLTIACPVPPVAPATNALKSPKGPDCCTDDCSGTTSPSAGVGSSARQAKPQSPPKWLSYREAVELPSVIVKAAQTT